MVGYLYKLKTKGKDLKRKHHYVSQFYLDGIASKRDFNRITVEGKENYFEDHHAFTKDELEEILIRDDSDSLLVTYKDFVKVQSFGLPLSLLDMHIAVDTKIYEKINNYIGRK